jgi:uracil-DNA glycosylase family 4
MSGRQSRTPVEALAVMSDLLTEPTDNPDCYTSAASPLARIQRDIRTCQRCVHAGFIPRAAPVLRGNRAARVMVVGQAPGMAGAERPLPYSGATGRTLRDWLARAEFPDDAFHDPDRFYLTSLTKCFPGKARQGAGDRAPSRREIALCSGHLAAELRSVRPELILALGRLSIEALLPSCRGLSLAEMVGVARPAELPAAADAGSIVLALPHPSGVSRWHNDPANRARVTLALEWLREERACRNL